MVDELRIPLFTRVSKIPAEDWDSDKSNDFLIGKMSDSAAYPVSLI